jgi:hypothetical protein
MKKNPYCRKTRYTFRQFLRNVPKFDERYMRDLYPERAMDECTEIVIYRRRYEEKKQDYFKKYPIWYALAKLLNRKEVK